MTAAILTLLIILAVAVVLFATEVVSVDVAAVALLLALYFCGLVTEAEVFAGFGSGVIPFLGALFVVTQGLVRTGALDLLEQVLARLAERRPALLLVLMMAGVGLTSALLSNTATMAAFLPVALGLARRLGKPPSKLLMPLAFVSILGGTCTLIGTSTNIVVSGALPSFGLEPLTFLELAPIGLPLLALGLLYLLTLGQRLLPEHREEPPESYDVRPYLAEARVPPGSPWIDKTLAETQAGKELDLTIVGRLGETRRVQPIAAHERLREDDVLVVQGPQESLLKLKQRRELDLSEDRRPEEPEGKGRPAAVHELLLTPQSRLAGKSLKEHQFRNRYGVSVLAVFRRGEARRRSLADLPLRDGDVLMVQGDLGRLRWLLRSGDLILLDQLEVRPIGRRLWLATGLFAAMIVAGGVGIVPFSVAALAAAAAMIVTGCLTSAEAYQAVDWRVLVMVGSLLVLATAMESSGTASYLAARIVEAAQPWGPLTLLGGFYLLTVALTQPMSNQAAALVVLPVAIQTAAGLGLDPRAFAVTVAVAASCSFVTPLEPASLLVYAAGKYRFRDFFVAGLPLTLLCLVVTLLVVPWLWPLG